MYNERRLAGVGTRVPDSPMTQLRVLSEPLGGGDLARRVIGGDAPDEWYLARPRTANEWRSRALEVAAGARANWAHDLAPAFEASGQALERLERVAAAGGVVVTTGQQPGLFGGPIYTWSKALSALELADALERQTGVPTLPVFWAATDDADFDEAASTWLALRGGDRRLTMRATGLEGVPMRDYPLGDVSDLLDALREAAGSSVDPGILDLVRLAYHSDATVGESYLTLLRRVLSPLGVVVLDASHPAVLAAERPWLKQALVLGEGIAASLLSRAAELRAVGFDPQVADVDGLSLVFRRDDATNRKTRVSLLSAHEVAASDESVRLSPNVLLRPVLERVILPTVGYLAGPGEIAYFAQVSAVAASLSAPQPLVLPRWSCTIVEAHVAELLERYGLAPADLSRPDIVEGRLARASAPAGLWDALARWREAVRGGSEALGEAIHAADDLVAPAVLEGALRRMLWRTERVERRLVAALKRGEEGIRRDVRTLRGALYPGGVRQERSLNLLPLLARHGGILLDAMRAEARRHAEAIVEGASLPVATA